MWLGSPQPSQQNPETEMESSRKNMRILLFNGVNACDIHRRPTRFWRILYQWKHCQLRSKGAEGRQNERRLSDSKHFIDRKQDEKFTELQTLVTLQEKGRMALREERQVQKTEPWATGDYSKPWNLKEFFQLYFETSWNQWLLSFHFLPFWMEMSVLFYACPWEQITCF